MWLLVLSLVGLSGFAFGDIYRGESIGVLETLEHDVTGNVYIVDEHRIRVTNFIYDGKGPDAYFLIGRKSGCDGGCPPQPSGQGDRVMDQYGRSLILDAYVNADLVLTLPDGVTVNDVNWLSVWCLQAGANFGELYFPDSFDVPSIEVLDPFSELAHEVSSGPVTILDKRRIKIENLNYDGKGPDAFFWVGTGSSPTTGGYIIPNEHGSKEILSAYNDETIILTLPHTMTVEDIGHISIWCRQFTQNFGHVTIPSNLMVPPYTEHLEYYFGKLLGDLKSVAHDTHGTVYMVDNRHIGIRNFFYDGLAPDAHVWVGEGDGPSEEGMKLPVIGLGDVKLGKYEDAEIVVEIPSDKMFTDFRWLSIWCVNVKENFAHIMIPSGYEFREPKTKNIGEITGKGHGVMSGNMTLFSDRTILITDLHYDGQGPDAFFYVGTGNEPSTDTGMKIPDERGSMEKARMYSGETITLTLPPGMSFVHLDWLSIYCIGFKENFGHVMIPDDLDVPGYTEVMTQLENCEQMNEYFNVAWEIDGEYINFEFIGGLDEFEYMSFGLSGDDTRFLMAGADVLAAYYIDEPVVYDLLLNAYSLCSASTGVCEDGVQGGSDDAENVEGFTVDGVTTIRFRRKIDTGDSKDKMYSGEKQIVWAMGNVNMQSKLITKHHTRITENMMINFDREPSYNCPPVKTKLMPPEPMPWNIEPIYGMNNDMFEVVIGPAGPQLNGYTAITGLSSWGIAWYVNGKLIPELILERHHTYTFKIFGGDNSDNAGQYHPFYITDDKEGGYADKTPEERAKVEIFAGPEEGEYCEYKVSQESDDNTDSFEDYFATLTKECARGGNEPGMLTWSPDDSTPNEVFYQCYTHKFLGYKIKVVPEISASAGIATPHVYVMITTLLAILVALKFM